MSIRKILSVTSVVCMMPLAACEESDEPTPVELEDGSASVAAADAAIGASSRDGASSPSVEADPTLVVDASGSSAGDASALLAADGGSSTPSAPVDSGSPPLNGDAGSQPDSGLASSRFFLPTAEPTNTSEAIVELDGQGNLHSVYPAYVNGGAYYSFCAAGDCDSQQDAKVVEFDTEGTVGTAMLALTREGKPRLVLSTFLRIYYAQCDQNCTERASWTFIELLNHNSELDATGEALALDGAGHPRLLLHGHRNPYEFFRPKRTETQLAQCDADCGVAANWRFDVISDSEIWEGSHLRFDPGGRAHVATTVFSYGEMAGAPLTAYLTCEGSCNALGRWSGTGFGTPVEGLTDAVAVHPSVSLALTKAGQPRVAMLIKDNQGKRSIGYAECDDGCASGDSWRGINLWAVDAPIGDGIDLALDSKGMPVFAHTINYNIVLTYCQKQPCTAQGAAWESTSVERGTDLPADAIFLEWNCTIGAWFLHTPSLALTADDKPRVGYQSRDISGGFSRPDPTKPRCTAGTDMTFSRVALLPSYIE